MAIADEAIIQKEILLARMDEILEIQDLIIQLIGTGEWSKINVYLVCSYLWLPIMLVLEKEDRREILGNIGEWLITVYDKIHPIKEINNVKEINKEIICY